MGRRAYRICGANITVSYTSTGTCGKGSVAGITHQSLYPGRQRTSGAAADAKYCTGILSRCRRFTQCGLGLDGSLSSYKRQRQRQLLPEARLFKLTASEDAGWGLISAQPTTLAHLRDVTTKSNTFPGFEHSVRQLRLQFLATLCRSRSSTTMPVSWSALAT